MDGCNVPVRQPEAQIHPISNVRRKPRITYKSPCSGDTAFIFGPFSLTGKSASSSSTPSPISLKVSTGAVQIACTSPSMKKRKYPTAPPLSLYHPLGRLASSLPPLDPTSVGLPVRSDDTLHSFARARRPAVKLRDGQDEPMFPPPAAATNPITDVEIREKPSPRKRRGGGGPKRKRREVDDGDATYPAKRTRIPRGTSNQLVAEDKVPLESTIPEVTPTPEPMSEAPEDRQPERRSRRSRGSAKRRDSSASEASNSPSAFVPSQDREHSLPMEVDKMPEPEPEPELVAHPVDVKVDEKEEGELSDDGLAVNPS